MIGFSLFIAALMLVTIGLVAGFVHEDPAVEPPQDTIELTVEEFYEYPHIEWTVDDRFPIGIIHKQKPEDTLCIINPWHKAEIRRIVQRPIIEETVDSGPPHPRFIMDPRSGRVVDTMWYDIFTHTKIVGHEPDTIIDTVWIRFIE